MLFSADQTNWVLFPHSRPTYNFHNSKPSSSRRQSTPPQPQFHQFTCCKWIVDTFYWWKIQSGVRSIRKEKIPFCYFALNLQSLLSTTPPPPTHCQRTSLARAQLITAVDTTNFHSATDSWWTLWAVYENLPIIFSRILNWLHAANQPSPTRILCMNECIWNALYEFSREAILAWLCDKNSPDSERVMKKWT